MARANQISIPVLKRNPVPLKKRSAEDVREEIARVDAAIEELSINDSLVTWRVLGSVSVPIALRSLRQYRNRLARL